MGSAQIVIGDPKCYDRLEFLKSALIRENKRVIVVFESYVFHIDDSDFIPGRLYCLLTENNYNFSVIGACPEDIDNLHLFAKNTNIYPLINNPYTALNKPYTQNFLDKYEKYMIYKDLNFTKTVNIPTIITCFYALQERDLTTGVVRNPNACLSKYTPVWNEFFSQPFPMVVYVEDSNLIGEFSRMRRDAGIPVEWTLFCVRGLEKFVFEFGSEYITSLGVCSKIVEKYKNLPIPHYIDTTKSSPWHVTLMHIKMLCVEETARNNPFNSDNFIWMDSGIFHVVEKFPLALTLYNIDKISMCMMNYPSINTIDYENNLKNYYSTLRWIVCGGLFIVPKEKVYPFYESYISELKFSLTNDVIAIDEMIFGLIVTKYRHIFDLYPGDYKSLIWNRMGVFRDISLAIRAYTESLKHEDDLSNFIFERLKRSNVMIE